MRKAKFVRIVYRDSYLTTLRKIARNKLVLASLVLIAAGIILLSASYQNNDVINSKFIQGSTVTSVNGSYSDVYFTQPARMNLTVRFSIPSDNIAQYRIYEVNNYSANNQPKTTLHQYTDGYASNGSFFVIDKVTGNIGQEYVVMIQSLGKNSFPVHVAVTTNIVLVEPSQRNVGAPGVILGMMGSILLAARVSFVYRAVNGL